MFFRNHRITDPKAEVFTELHYESFPGADDDEYIAPATVFYRNSLGGSVCSMVFHHRIVYSLFNEPRKNFLIELLERLRGGKLPVVSADAQNITALARKYPDGTVLAEICNINFDPLKKISLRCAEIPIEVERLTGDGTWVKAPFEADGNIIKVNIPLACYELAILRIR